MEQAAKPPINFVAQKMFGLTDDEADEFADAFGEQIPSSQIIEEQLTPALKEKIKPMLDWLRSGDQYEFMVEFFKALNYQPTASEIRESFSNIEPGTVQ